MLYLAQLSEMTSIGGGTTNHFGSPHSDVLSVSINETSTAEQRETLYAELQRRSKAAVQAKQWYDAVTLYTKAIECCGGTSSDKNDATSAASRYLHTLPLTKATLYANISLCLGKMNRWTEAVTNAQQSVDSDATYMKGWYRLGQAQAMEKAFSHAIAAYEKAMALDPSNTVLQKELEKCKVALEAKEKEDAENETKDETTTTTASTKTTTKVSTKVVTADDDITMKVMDRTTDNDIIMDDSINNEFTKSDYVRGYKIVNGKKTSYFHNELSEDAKQLIGDIAPKKIDPTDASMAVSSTTTTAAEEGKSVWNKAGTWEEKDCTHWATDTITDMLQKVSYTLPSSSPAPNAVISISKIVVQPNSHASFATVRTKKRYIYELDLIVHWNFVHQEMSASGTIRFPDIDGTCVVGDGYEATEFVIVQMDDPTLQPVLTQFCYNQGLRLSIHETIDNWVRLFKDSY